MVSFALLFWLFRMFEMFPQYSLSSNKIHYNILHQKTRIDEISGEFFMECQYVFRRNFDDQPSVIQLKREMSINQVKNRMDIKQLTAFRIQIITCFSD